MIVNYFEHTDFLRTLRDACSTMTRAYSVLGPPSKVFPSFTYHQHVITARWTYLAREMLTGYDWDLYIERKTKKFYTCFMPSTSFGERGIRLGTLERWFRELEVFRQGDGSSYYKQAFSSEGSLRAVRKWMES